MSSSSVQYSIIDLSSCMDNTMSRCSGINQKGDVTLIGLDRYERAHSFLYADGKFIDLGTVNGRHCHAIGLNDHRVVIGSINQDRDEQRAFVWSDGKLQLLATLGGAITYATGINNAGVICGVSQLDTQHGGALRAVLWKNGKIEDMGKTLPGREHTFGRINNAGACVGTLGGGPHRAFLYHDGKVTIVKEANSGRSINNQNNIVGNIYYEGVDYGFLYKNNRLKILSTLGVASYAHDINDSDLIVGNSIKSRGNGTRACLWKNEKIVDINLQIDKREKWELIEACAINNQGKIVGYGIHINKERAYLLVPKK